MLIDDLPALATFARIVAAGSLSAAARELDLSLSVVSKRLAQLETRLGVRLLQRTTRQQTLTDEGALFHAQVVRILAEIEQAESLMRERRGTVSGALRITAPGELGRRRIAPIVAAFQRQHPQVTVQMQLTDAVVDLIAHDVDVAVRIGMLADSARIAREGAPRTTRAQSLDVLSSQANIAGYKAVLVAAALYPRFFPMLMTAAGTVKAARVLVLGAGVAGLQAIATAKRLGAVIEASDVRPAVKEQIESLGAKFLDVPYETQDERDAAQGVGGYARPMPASWLGRQAARGRRGGPAPPRPATAPSANSASTSRASACACPRCSSRR